MPDHPLLDGAVIAAIAAEVSAHLGVPWHVVDVTDLGERSSHPAAILRGESVAVFAKLGVDRAHVAGELAALALLRDRGGVRTPLPIGNGIVTTGDRCVLLTEAVDEVPPSARSAQDWRAIGAALAALHRVQGERFGLDAMTWFGSIAMDNRPVDSNRWCDF